VLLLDRDHGRVGSPRSVRHVLFPCTAMVQYCSIGAAAAVAVMMKTSPAFLLCSELRSLFCPRGCRCCSPFSVLLLTGCLKTRTDIQQQLPCLLPAAILLLQT
jgi:hypothetical protein